MNILFAYLIINISTMVHCTNGMLVHLYVFTYITLQRTMKGYKVHSMSRSSWVWFPFNSKQSVQVIQLTKPWTKDGLDNEPLQTLAIHSPWAMEDNVYAETIKFLLNQRTMAMLDPEPRITLVMLEQLYSCWSTKDLYHTCSQSHKGGGDFYSGTIILLLNHREHWQCSPTEPWRTVAMIAWLSWPMSSLPEPQRILTMLFLLNIQGHWNACSLKYRQILQFLPPEPPRTLTLLTHLAMEDPVCCNIYIFTEPPRTLTMLAPWATEKFNNACLLSHQGP